MDFFVCDKELSNQLRNYTMTWPLRIYQKHPKASQRMTLLGSANTNSVMPLIVEDRRPVAFALNFKAKWIRAENGVVKRRAL